MNIKNLNEFRLKLIAEITETIENIFEEFDFIDDEIKYLTGEISQERALLEMKLGNAINFPSNECPNNKHIMQNEYVIVTECYEHGNGVFSPSEWMDKFSHIIGWRII